MQHGVVQQLTNGQKTFDRTKDLDLQVFLLAISDAVQLKFVQSTAMAWRPKKILLDGRCLRRTWHLERAVLVPSWG